MRGLFVTATDTSVGKTILSAALLAAIAADGQRVSAHKPVVTGLDDMSVDDTPDHELLAAAAGMAPAEVAPLRYGPAVSPQLAAELAGERIDPSRLLARAAAAGADTDVPLAARGERGDAAEPAEGGETRVLIVEGVGGLLTPLAESLSVCDFAAALGLPVLVAARPGLGTINHTLLTIQAARSAGLDVRAVVLTPWPQRPSRLELSNRATITRTGEIEVEILSRVRRPDPVALAGAGAALPWRGWLGESSLMSIAGQ